MLRSARSNASSPREFWGQRPLRVVLVKAANRREGYDVALITMDMQSRAAEIIERYDERWAIEVSYEDAKQITVTAIAKGDAPAEIVWADDLWVAFLPLEPTTPGHTLVIPRTHVPDLWSVEPQLGSELTNGGRALRWTSDQHKHSTARHESDHVGGFHS